MATLQVRDLPEEVHEKLTALAAREHRSLSQQVLVLLMQALEHSESNKARRQKVLDQLTNSKKPKKPVSDPVKILREDRDR